MDFIPDNLFVNLGVLLVSFVILTKSADFLVDGAVGIAERFHIPKIIIGIVLVSFATTSPEFTVSLVAAIKGQPEFALGNAVGSVIVNIGVAMALAILLSRDLLKVERSFLGTTGVFLFSVCVLAFILAFNGVLQRREGILLLGLLAAYLAVLVRSESKKRRKRKIDAVSTADNDEIDQEVSEHEKPGGVGLQLFRFAIGVAGVIIASRLLVESADRIAQYLGVPEVIIGLTVLAIGTSLPEIATCIVAARKGHAELALGDIVGANILNILWIIGAASAANPIIVARGDVIFMFPFMLVIVGALLLLGRWKLKFHRWKGALLLAAYVGYLTITILLY